LKDPTSKLVRGTAYQNIGPFLANYKNQGIVDQRIVDFYITTTEATNNKDVCYYSAFNYPAFIYVLGDKNWVKFRSILMKLSRFNDFKIQKTLAHSLHEISRILGPEITEEDIVPIMDKFISDKTL
jgi:serine/threonine-protein phosphatase 4 regulatory subunit 1